jgi:hypothetical protein
MRVSRRVDQAVNKLVAFVENEIGRHPNDSPQDYRLYLCMGMQEKVPVVGVMLENAHRPRVASMDCYSLYHFRPLVKHHAYSRTLALIDGAANILADKGIQIM